MANEISVRVSLGIRSSPQDYQSRPTSFRASLVGPFKGPTPGAVAVGVTHTLIDLDELTTPGLCWLQNTGGARTIEVGIFHGASGHFIPLLELLPGECVVLRLSSLLSTSLDSGTGTGTSDTSTNHLAAKAVGGNAVLRVDAFER